ncbi:MAG: hypothetical protein EAZ94_24230 [Oscillatoriales cyanobacterium]|nr:MAG: hypothetical protein EAZ94_24230 [Oscillatoriales cyanobacterium]
MFIGVNLTSNLLSVFCLAIKASSPLAPRSKGGTRVFSFVPLFKGDLGGSGFGQKRELSMVPGLS